MEKIKEAIGIAKWWLKLPPQKKLWIYLLGGIAVSLFIVKVLWEVIEGNNADNKADYAQCKEENKQWGVKYGNLEVEYRNLEADYRNYLKENNREKRETLKEIDSLKMLFNPKNKQK